MTVYKILFVGLGGFLGSIIRYITVKTLDDRINALFPFGTFFVNFTGSLLLGFIFGLSLKRVDMNEHWKLFLGTGFCGGFTTFSAFALENYNLLGHKPAVSILYIIASIMSGLVGIAAGIFLSKNT